MKQLKTLSFSLILSLSLVAQTSSKPKLVIGLVVDQMRWDYLYKFSNRYGNDGFKRLIKEGFSCENTFIPYMPTHTAPGHASIYTGSVPALHGIMGNNWYDRRVRRTVYCTEDSTVKSIGTTAASGKMSPRNIWSNTVTDELRLASNFHNKTIAVALKDRGAIIPGGHTANAAYWFDNNTGGWISSSFYMDSLPAWVTKVNEKKMPDVYLKQNWNTLYPINTYTQSSADVKNYEGKLPGEDNNFPHETAGITKNKYESFRYTPYGNTYTLDFARSAIEAERLGKSGSTDFLSISLSSPDYIGHAFGPNSIEIEDNYLRLDRDLAAFFKYLDAQIGKGQYLLFLTSDHGVAHVPGFAVENKLPGVNVDDQQIRKSLNDSLEKEYKVASLIEHTSNYYLFLNHELIKKNNLEAEAIKATIIRLLLKSQAIGAAFDPAVINKTSLPDRVKMVFANGYNQKLSGDVQYLFKPQWYDAWSTGASHGVWNPYDSHIPLIWFGWNIKPGKLNREVYMTDIAPTLAALLHIQAPNATIGKVIEEAIK